MKLFFGNCSDKILESTAIEDQKKFIKKIWSNDNKAYFGIIRIIRILLSLYPFLFPTLYIRHFAGKKSWINRRFWIEIQVIFKVIFPVVALSIQTENKLVNNVIVFITIYFILETFLYLLTLVFLSDIRSELANKERSIVLILINYLELTLDYAVIYKILDLLTVPDKYVFFVNGHCKLITSLEAVYFSFVTSTTLGFGDYAPNIGLGQVVTILQSMSMLTFVVLFMNYFIANLKK